jgi:hypothetical protein
MHAFEEQHHFDHDAAFVVASDDSDSDEDGPLTPAQSSQELADLLGELKLRGKLSARDVCLISWYAKLAGLTGAAADFAFRPSAPTGHYNRHFKAVLKLGMEVESSYTFAVPGHDRYSTDRMVHQVPAIVPHETLAAELVAEPHLLGRLQNSVRDVEWSDVYYNHPVVQAAAPGEAVWPLSVYIDGVPFAKRDGLLGLWCCNMVSDARHLLLTLRKSQMCRCGCLSWCSLFAMWNFVAWSFAALAAGRWPSLMHDGQPWGDDDEHSHRREMAAKPMMRGALMHLKGDWAEIVHTFGFCSWSHVIHPCWCCWSSKDKLTEIGDTSCLGGPCREKSADDYEEACRSCERFVTVADRRQQAVLSGLLFYDKRKGIGGRGRCLRSDYEPLHLLQGDRLEPCTEMQDTSVFESLVPPFRALFWRPANETLVRHRCPLFLVLGATLLALSIDVLHTLHLGVYKAFCMAGIWACIRQDVWNINAPTMDVRIMQCCQRLRQDLFEWYRQKAHESPDEPLYRISDLTTTMIGTNRKPCLATKAAETGTLLEFVRDLVRRYEAVLGQCGVALCVVGDSLVALRNVMRSAPRRVSVAQAQLMVDSAKRAMAHREAANIDFSPKWHLMLHVVSRAFSLGNPAHYATFLDESLNGFLAKMAASSHRATWHKSVLSAFRWVAKCSKRQRRK